MILPVLAFVPLKLMALVLVSRVSRRIKRLKKKKQQQQAGNEISIRSLKKNYRNEEEQQINRGQIIMSVRK